MLDDAALVTGLLSAWGWTPVSLTPLDTGMNSRTWWVHHDGARRVAKWVPADEAEHLRAGVGAAAYAASSGLRTGSSLPCRDGRAGAELAGGLLVVLDVVPGRELSGEEPDDAAAIGRTLARAHRATVGRRAEGAWEFPWVDPDAAHLAIDDEVRSAVRVAVEAVDAVPAGDLTTGICHGDPAPEAFLRDGAEVGLIDWGSCVNGPLLYDLASAAMYLGGLDRSGPMLAAYSLAGGPVPDAEVARHAPTLLRWRWAVQADYFARRLAGDDTEENREGLADARRRLVPA